MDRELRDRLYWLEEELLEQELEEIDISEAREEAPSRRRLSRAQKQERQRLQEIDPIEERSLPAMKKKGIKGLLFLAVLEMIGILAIIGWWLQWLI